MGNSRAHLQPELRTDKNGVSSTRWVRRPRTATLTQPPASPAIAAMTEKQELDALHKELVAAMEEHGHPSFIGANLGLINAMHEYGRKDYRDVFRSILNNVSTEFSMGLIDGIHESLREHGVDVPSEIIDAEATIIAEDILDSLKLSSVSDNAEASAIIHHALTSEDRGLISGIIAEHKPQTVDHLKELEHAYRSVAPSLRGGAL